MTARELAERLAAEHFIPEVAEVIIAALIRTGKVTK